MRRWMIATAIAVAVGEIWNWTALAQISVARAYVIEGHVTSGNGAPLARVGLGLRLEANVIQRTVTDADGAFRFVALLQPGRQYGIQFTQPGFSTEWLRLSPPQAVENAPLASQQISVQFRAAPTAASHPPSTDNQPNHTVVGVFYATDRARPQTTPISFGPQRNSSGALALGRFDVSIPRDHRMGSVERPSIWTFRREDPARDFVIVGRSQLSTDRYYGEIAARVAQSKRKEVFVFVHGFNVPFETAIYRTAQIAYDLGFDGAPILYSWPSEGKVDAYPVDQNNADWTIPHLRWFLEDVSRKSGAQTIHLIAHSMGNRALVGALREMSTGANRSRFNQIVLTAPDIDAGVFSGLAAAITGLGRRITLYASSNDLALKASQAFQGYQRAGDSRPQVVVVPGIDTIDVSSADDTSFLGHSYYGDSKTFLNDLFALINEDKPPAQRFRLHEAGGPARRWWVLSP